ncbi:glucosaminidase domain-containing protein [Enterococcus sp. AZ072]|uniref:glucosaminidase domain-containing protein n=1 Tax=unclassified Enterococcus TaxID=2608891 RepID=UPI003D29901D
MNGRFLLSCFGVSICLFTIYQTQIVSAEVKESVASISQQETMPSTVVSSNSCAAQESIESTMSFETSSIEENKSSKTKESAALSSIEQKKTTEESLTSASAVLETTTVKVQTALPAKKVEENYQFSVSKNQTTEAFIQLIGEEAQVIAWQEELYASVMIAQAILETGSGNSKLAQPPYHNLFGIKGSYQGKQVSFKTQEDKGDGELYTIQSAFRQYPSYKESLEDYAALLRKGISGNAGFYQETWKSNAATYQEAAKALTGKYATDTTYDKKLVTLIEAYNLTIYDKDPARSVEAEKEQPTDNPVGLEDRSEEQPTVEESNETGEQPIIVNETTQSAVIIPPTAQRPAKQLYGNRSVQ